MRHEMKLQPEPFEKVKNRTKTIEIRLNDEKRQKLNVGDEIEFSLMTDPTQTLIARVLHLTSFPSFKDLFEAFPPESYGGKSQDEYAHMYKYYSKEDEEKYGTLAINISVQDDTPHSIEHYRRAGEIDNWARGG